MHFTTQVAPEWILVQMEDIVSYILCLTRVIGRILELRLEAGRDGKACSDSRVMVVMSFGQHGSGIDQCV